MYLVCMATPLKGRFKPKNPEKYRGDPTNIIYRSSWERDVMSFMDSRSDVVYWMSEERCFPYKDFTTKKVRRYFPDIICGIKREYGIETRVIEIKPKKYTQPPKLPKSGRKTKSYNYHLTEYIRNECKWKSMRDICEDRGWNFQIITEDDVSRWSKRK